MMKKRHASRLSGVVKNNALALKGSDIVVQTRFFLRRAGLECVEEYKFCAGRRWSFDFALPDAMIAVECDGMTGARGHVGRHRSVTGFAGDMEKLNMAAALGWRVFRVAPDWAATALADGRKERHEAHLPTAAAVADIIAELLTKK